MEPPYATPLVHAASILSSAKYALREAPK